MTGPPTGTVRRRAKVLVLGATGTGKTTFIGSASDIDPIATDVPMAPPIDGDDPSAPGPTTTAAIDVGRVDVDGHTLLLVATAPPQRVPELRDDLGRGAAGAIVLVDPARASDSYPDIVAASDGRLPFLVAVNPIGRDRTSIDAALRMGPDVPVSVCDARDRASVKATLRELLDIVATTTIVEATATATAGPAAG